MYDLAAIVSGDGPSFLLWLLLAFSAGMYPVGLMLGAPCSACCCPDCDSSTVTVSISGMSEDPEVIQALVLLFSSDFGSGATADVTEPGSPGPITEVNLTSGGSGYARATRVIPTLTATAGGGGSNATFSITYDETTHDGREAWSVDSISVSNAGSGYPNTGSLTFALGSNDTKVYDADAQYKCSRTVPSVSLSVSGNGSGAQLTASLTYYAAEDFWYVGSVTVDNAGSGYTAGDEVVLTIDDGEAGYIPFAMTVTVNGNGEITGVSVDDPFGSEYWNRGSYWVNTGEIESVTVNTGGLYYGLDPNTSEVANVTVTVAENPQCPRPVLGSGAQFSVTIDDDEQSGTYGQITAVTIVAGGDDYLAYITRYQYCYSERYNGKQFVLKRSTTNPCLYRAIVGRHVDAAVAPCGEYASVESCGSAIEVLFGETCITATISDVAGEASSCTAIENLCEATLTGSGGLEIEVTRGGDYAEAEPYTCGPCCRNSETPPPEEIEAEFSLSGTLENGQWDLNAFGDPTPVVLAKATPMQISNTRAGEAGIFGSCDALYWINVSGWDVVVGMSPCRRPCDGIDCDGCDLCEPMLYVRSPCAQGTSFMQDWGTSSPCQACSSLPMCSPQSAVLTATRSIYWFTQVPLACGAVRVQIE